MNVCLQDTPVILIQTPDKNNNEEKKCMFQTSLWGVGASSVSYKKGLPRGVPPPLVSIHKFNVWLPPPYRVGLPQGDAVYICSTSFPDIWMFGRVGMVAWTSLRWPDPCLRIVPRSKIDARLGNQKSLAGAVHGCCLEASPGPHAGFKLQNFVPAAPGILSS